MQFVPISQQLLDLDHAGTGTFRPKENKRERKEDRERKRRRGKGGREYIHKQFYNSVFLFAIHQLSSILSSKIMDERRYL